MSARKFLTRGPGGRYSGLRVRAARACLLLILIAASSMPCTPLAAAPPDEGLKAEMAGNWQQAIAIYRHTLQREPGRAELWERIADIRNHIEDRAGAIAALRQAVRLKPDDAALNSKLATLLAMEKRPGEALIHAAKAVQEEPDNVEYLRRYAQLANWLKRFGEAAASYARIYALQPGNEKALRDLAATWTWDGRPEKAIELYENYLRGHPRKPEIWIALSDARVKNGDRAGGIAALVEAAGLRPKDAAIDAKLSSLYAVDNRPEKALEYSRRAVENSPDNISYLRAHAQLANWLKRPLEAARSLERITRLKPDDAAAWLDLANTYKWAGQPGKAVAIYEKYLQRSPDDIKSWLLLADSKKSQGDTAGAAETVLQAYRRFFHEERSTSGTLSRRSGKLPVLLYHCIGDRADNDYWITREEFSAQMKQLREKGYHAVTSRDLESYLFRKGSLPEKPVMITFDDGCRNLYRYAWPILKENGFVGDIYLFTQAIRDTPANRARIVQHVDGKDTELEYLIWPEIEEMVEGGMVIGAHSKSHADLGKIDSAALKYEIIYPKLRILAETGISVTSFSYPFGSGFNRKEAHRILRSAGYDLAFAAHGGVESLDHADPMKIRRIEIWGPHSRVDPGSRGVSVTPDPVRPYDLFLNRLQPDVAGKHFEQARLYSTEDKAQLAYREIEKALALDGNNRRYLRFMSQMAEWTGHNDEALAAYRKLIALGEDERELLLGQARLSSYSGELDRSIGYYRRYLESYPDNRSALLESARVEAWRGDRAAASALLERYRQRFGEDRSWLEAEADLLSWSDRPQQTSRLIAPTLKQNPNDYKMGYADVLALHFAHRDREALSRLRHLEASHPGADGIGQLRDIVTRPLRPRLSLESAYLSSSQDLEALTTSLRGRYSPTPELQIDGRFSQEWFSARQGSGLVAIDGSEGAQYQSMQAGVGYRFSPRLSADLHLGQAWAEGDSLTIFSIGTDIEPLDSLDLRIEHSSDYFHNYYASSPRTVSLGIKVDVGRITIDWRPDFNYRISAIAASSSFSDDNSSRYVYLALQRAVARTQRWNIDLGLSAAVLDFEQRLDHGYYDPANYQRFMLTNSNYWKMGERGGINISLAVGSARDDAMENFEFASEASIGGELRLDRDWLFSFGISGVHNVTRGGGAYKGNGITVSLSRIF